MTTGILDGGQCGVQFAANVRFVDLTEVAAPHELADAIFCVSVCVWGSKQIKLAIL